MARCFIVYDTESTGLKRATVDLTLPASLRNRGDEVCQIGGIILDENMNPQKLFCHYCDTVAPEVSAGAFAVNGISMKEVRKYVQCQYLSNVIQEYLPEFLYEDVIFIGYNVEFDQGMVKQTISNSDMDFTWTSFKGNILPRTGRYAVDIAIFFKKIGNTLQGKSSYYRRLSSFEKELEPDRQKFLEDYGTLEIQTNCWDLLAQSWANSHNAFFDALNTFLLWRDRVWQKKLI